MRLRTATTLTAVLLAASVSACGSSGSSDSKGSSSSGGSSKASSSADAGGTTKAASSGGGTDACALVPQAMLEKTLKATVGAGTKKKSPGPDLNSCHYQPSEPGSYVLVQATGKADLYFPKAMYPLKGQKTVPVPGADRGYATIVTNHGPLDPTQVFVVKGGKGVQVTVSVNSAYTTDDMVSLGKQILAEL